MSHTIRWKSPTPDPHFRALAAERLGFENPEDALEACGSGKFRQAYGITRCYSVAMQEGYSITEDEPDEEGGITMHLVPRRADGTEIIDIEGG
jgi:hypothetical protein